MSNGNQETGIGRRRFIRIGTGVLVAAAAGAGGYYLHQPSAPQLQPPTTTTATTTETATEIKTTTSAETVTEIETCISPTLTSILSEQKIPLSPEISMKTSSFPIPKVANFDSEGNMAVDSNHAGKVESTVIYEENGKEVSRGDIVIYLKRYRPTDSSLPSRWQLLFDFASREYALSCRDTVELRTDRRANRQYIVDKDENITNQENSNPLPHEDDFAARVMVVNSAHTQEKITKPGELRLDYCYDFGDRKRIWQQIPDSCLLNKWDALSWIGTSPNERNKNHWIALLDFLEYVPINQKSSEISVNPYQLKRLPVMSFMGHIPETVYADNVPYKGSFYIEGFRGTYKPPWTPLGQANDIRSWPWMSITE